MAVGKSLEEKTMSVEDTPGSLMKRDINLPWSLISFGRTLWLFSYSDIFTFIVPATAFGVLGALSGSSLSTNSYPDPVAILSRAPLSVLFVWLNALVFGIANQRLPASVIEDTLNKPWRPLPKGRITPVQARRFLMAVLPVILGISYFMGVWRETSLLFSLTWMYNDLNGGDENFIVRNAITAAAYAVYNEGALRIACGPDHYPAKAGYLWTATVGCVILSTMQVQDMKDQEGDRATGRSTAPLVFGDYVARWMVAVPVVSWSLICPLMWNIGILGWIPTIAIGFVVAVRVLWLRDFESDRNTWQIWASWLSYLYLLPLLKAKALSL